MIKSVYGNAIVLELQKAIAANSWDVKPHFYECDTCNLTDDVSGGAVQLPIISPWCLPKYLIAPQIRTFQTTTTGGKILTHVFDMVNTMPVIIHVPVTLLAYNVSDIVTMENALQNWFAKPKTLMVDPLPNVDGSLPVFLTLDTTKEIARERKRMIIQQKQTEVFQSVIYLKCERCVAFYISYPAAQIGFDRLLQEQIMARISTLDATQSQFSDAVSKYEGTTEGVTKYSLEDIAYMKNSIGAIRVAREALIKAVGVPDPYKTSAAVKSLLNIMKKNSCTLNAAIKTIEMQKRAQQQNPQVNFNNFDQIFAQFSNTRQRSAPPVSSEERKRQIQNLKKALDLQTALDACAANLSRLRSMQYKDPPEMPTKPKKAFVPSSIYSCMTMDGYINSFIGMFKRDDASNKRKEEMERQLAERRAAAEVQYAEQLVAYEQAVKDHSSIVLPKYQKEKAVWEAQRQREIAGIEAQQQQHQKDLASHYEETKIVPVQYRQTAALRYIYDVMSSSNFTLAQAIDNYEQAVRRQIEQERLYEERRRADAAERTAYEDEEVTTRASSTTEAADRGEYRDGGHRNHSSLAGSFARGFRNGMNEYEEARQQKRMMKDYYNTSKCQRYGLHGKRTCAGCPIAHMCKH